MRFRSNFARAALLGAVLPSTILAACGGGGDDDELVAVDTWVRSLCSAAARFDVASDEAGDAFVEAVDESPEDTAAIKEGFAESIELQKEAQKTFRDEFEDLGKPDVDDPDAIIKAFRDQFEENDDRTDQIARDIADIADDEDFFEAFMALDIEEPNFRARLEPLADDDEAVQRIIDEIEANNDCAVVLFDAEPSGSDPEPTPAGNATPRPTVDASPRSQAWVGGVCGSLLDWVTDLENANTDLQLDADAAADAEGLKQVLVTFLEQGLTDTRDFQAEIESLTPPDVSDGEDIHRVFTGVAEDLVVLFEDFVVDANNIDASSLTSVATDLEGFEQRVGFAFDEVGAAFDELDMYDPEGLDVLFATLPECTALSQ